MVFLAQDKNANTQSRITGKSRRLAHVTCATLALGVLALQSPAAFAHCKWNHPDHCVGKVVSGAVGGVTSVGKKILGSTAKSAKTVWKHGVEKPYRIVDRTIPSPIPYAEYILRNPDEIVDIVRNPTNIVGAPLAAVIADSRNKVLSGGTRPLPPEIRAHFKGEFSDKLLQSVRYTTGNSVFNGIAPFASLSTQASAITLVNVIVFKKAPESISLWAHELYHVNQYKKMGLLKFARTLTLYGYKNKQSPIEAPAYRYADNFVQNNVRKTGSGNRKTCFNAIQNKVAWNRSGSKSWAPANIKRLCASKKPTNLKIRCFSKNIKQHNNWRMALNRCT